MTVSDPAGQDWTGTQLYETITVTSNSCSTDVFPVPTSAPNPFTVGAGGAAFGVSKDPTTNVIWDLHYTTLQPDGLTVAGQTSCTQVATQSYSCRGTTLGNTFVITRQFTKDTINSVSVTRVALTKQLQ